MPGPKGITYEGAVGAVGPKGRPGFKGLSGTKGLKGPAGGQAFYSAFEDNEAWQEADTAATRLREEYLAYDGTCDAIMDDFRDALSLPDQAEDKLDQTCVLPAAPPGHARRHAIAGW